MRPDNRLSLQSLEPRRLLSGSLSSDSTWGVNGFVTAPAATAGYTSVLDIGIAPNGQSVALAQGNGLEVVRYNIDGSVDDSFGVNGRFALSFTANAVQVERDGSVLVAGPNTVLRLTSNGNTDDSFGAGGIVSLASDGTIISQAQDMRERPDGSIILLRSGTTDGLTAAATVTHIRTNGDIDSSFAGDGSSSFVIPIGLTGLTNVSEMALSNDGSLVYFGGTNIASVRVARCTDFGVLDRNFQVSFNILPSTVLDGIEVSEIGDVLTLTHTGTPSTANPASVRQFDDAGDQIASTTILPLVVGQTPTMIAQGGGRVLVGFQDPYTIARLASDQIAPGVFLTGGVLSVDGGLGDDTILVNRSDTQIRITRDGKKTFVDRSDVTQIILNGHAGNDVLTVTVSIPTVALGELGDDTITTGDANDTLSGADGNDSLTANGGNDLLDGGVGADRLIGGSGADRMSGGGGKDRMYGGSGNDQMDGGAGDDFLYGQSGNDKLFGGRGNDLLDGDGGTNQFFPGEGHDTVLGST